MELVCFSFELLVILLIAPAERYNNRKVANKMYF
jgi:hypothetical protein